MVPSRDDVPAPQRPLRLGELLVAAGVLSREQLAHALDVQAAVGRPLGDLCERLFDLDPVAIDAAWAQQFAASRPPRDVSLDEPDARCVRLLKPRQAWQFRLMPLRFESLPSEPDTPRHLVLATTADGLRRAINFASRCFTVPPSLVVATDESLRRALERHYPVSRQLAAHAFPAA